MAYGGVTLADVDAIADAVARGGVVERLVVHRGNANEANETKRPSGPTTSDAE